MNLWPNNLPEPVCPLENVYRARAISSLRRRDYEPTQEEISQQAAKYAAEQAQPNSNSYRRAFFFKYLD